MRKFIIKQELRIMEMADIAKRYGKDKANQAVELIKNKDGELTTDQLIWVIIGITLGAIVLVGIIAYIKNKFFPALDTKTDEFLNMK